MNVYHMPFPTATPVTFKRWLPLKKEIIKKNRWVDLDIVEGLRVTRQDYFGDSELYIDPKLDCWSDSKSIIIITPPKGPPWPDSFNSKWDQNYVFKTLLEVNENLFYNYKGKIIVLNDQDCNGYLKDHFNNTRFTTRVDSFITLVRSSLLSTMVMEKCVLIPRYIVSTYGTGSADIKKTKGIFFNGMIDESRLKAVEILKRSELARFFEGGITIPPDNFEYESSSNLDLERYSDLIVDRVSVEDHFKFLLKYLISLCGTRGNGTFSFRHIESLQASCAIISGSLDFEIDEDFLYKDKIEKLFYIFKKDFSDFLDVCQYCLDNETETELRGKEGYNVFKKYWELNIDDTYKENVWRDIQSQFLELNIII